MTREAVMPARLEGSTLFTGLAIGAFIGIALPRLIRVLDFVHTHFIHTSKLSRYHHTKSLSASSDAKSQPSGIGQSNLITETAAAEPWAIITGATDGIGASFARSLSRRGFNLILHGRNPSKLDRLISDLHKQHTNRSFMPLIADASDRASFRSTLDSFVQDVVKGQNLNLTVLINNIGGLGGLTAFLRAEDRTKLHEVEDIIDVNMTFPVEITRSLLPILKSNSPALIVNLCSTMSIHSLPYLALYCGCKAFNWNWGRSLRLEMLAEKDVSSSRGAGAQSDLDVEVLNLTLSQVKTAGAGDVPISFFTPASDDFVENHAMQKIGIGWKKGSVCAYWRHELQAGLLNLLWGKAYDQALLKAGKEQYENESIVRPAGR